MKDKIEKDESSSKLRKELMDLPKKFCQLRALKKWKKRLIYRKQKEVVLEIKAKQFHSRRLNLLWKVFKVCFSFFSF